MRRAGKAMPGLLMSGTLLAGLVLFPGSGPLAQSLVSPEERSHLKKIDQSRWQGELYLDEFQPRLSAFYGHLADADLLRTMLGADFRGEAPSRRRQTSRAVEGGLTVTTYDCAALEPAPTDGYLDQLARYVATFATIERTEVHVRRVTVQEGTRSPTVDVDLDTLLVGTAAGARRTDRSAWSATLVRADDGTWTFRHLGPRTLETAAGERTFTDVTGLLPPSSRMTHPKTNKYTDFPANNGVALADWDQDGDLDIYVFRPYLPGLFYENDGTGRFRDHVPPGLEEPPPGPGGEPAAMSGSGYFFDADNDGDLDFIQLRNNAPIRYFRNEGGRFKDVSREAGFARLPGSFWIGAAIGDYDRDGFLDLYLLRYADRDPRASYFDSPGNPSFLMHNEGNGTFLNATDRSGMSLGRKHISWAAAWGDYNSDGFPDLYVANDFGPNTLFTNHKDGTFSEDAAKLGVEDRGNGMGASWADYDNDGVLDLYVSNMHSYAGERITHTPIDYLTPAQADLARKFSKGNSLFRGLPDGTFKEATPQVAVAEAGWAWGHLFFDYDNDGDQDLYVVNGYFSNIKPTDT